MRAEEAKGNNKRGESPLSSSDPADNDDNKEENALLALTNAATMSGQPHVVDGVDAVGSRVLRANHHASMVLMAGGGMGVATQWIPQRSRRPRCSILP